MEGEDTAGYSQLGGSCASRTLRLQPGLWLPSSRPFMLLVCAFHSQARGPPSSLGSAPSLGVHTPAGMEKGSSSHQGLLLTPAEPRTSSLM